MHAYIHTHTHTYIHTYIHTCSIISTFGLCHCNKMIIGFLCYMMGSLWGIVLKVYNVKL